MTPLFQRLLLALLFIGSAAPLLAQIPPQTQRPTNPNAVPPFNRPRPGVPPTAGQRPAAAQPGGAEERVAIRPEDAVKPGGGVELQFPNTPLSQILLVYEELTGLKIIRDASIEQATVSIETTGELPKERAIMFIEKSLLLNGYSFVPAGDGMVKILGSDKRPTSDGAPLFEAVSDLPETDQVVSFVAILQYLNPDDAVKAIDAIIPRHSYGSITPVPNAKALVIVENSNTIRSILELLDRLDVKPGATVTKRIQLIRADAEDVKTALNEILGLDEEDSPGGAPGSRPTPQQQPGMAPVPPGQLPGVSTSSTAAEVKPKILAIPRTNRLLVIAMPETAEYIETLVVELDSASELRTFVSRTLKYLSVEAAMGIIGDAISRTEGEGSGSAGGGVNSLGQPNNASGSRNNTGTGTGTSGGLFGNTGNNSMNNTGGFGSSGGLGGGGFGNSGGGFGGGMGGGGGFGGGSGGGNLTPLRSNNGPVSMVVGKTLLISDPTANSIFASGPPEHLRILNEILDELDRRPQQILISAVIGEIQLGRDESFGLETLFRARRNGTETGASAGLAGQLGNSITPLDPRQPIPLADLAARTGLTFYGGIREGVDVILSAMHSRDDFKVISRPSVFTMNNTPANISSGSSFPIATSTQGFVGGGANNGLLSNVAYQDVVLSLNIIPLINTSDELTLQISQENSEVAGSTVIAENTYPVLTKQQLNTVVMCKNNSTVLLGGLIRESQEKNNVNVPFLANIPLLKYLTGSTSDSKNRRELLIFIQPRIVESQFDLPPTVRDGAGTSPFGQESMAFFDHEKNMDREAAEAAKQAALQPSKRSRISSMVRKLFSREESDIEAPKPVYIRQ